MACSKYQYVKKFEESSHALLETYMVVRVDGRAFTKFCLLHEFEKPNDLRAISLMNRAAEFVCDSFKQIFLAYGQSDEYSFAFSPSCALFSRRIDKIQSCVVSAFSSAYVYHWKHYFVTEMKEIPTFDSRIVTYPNEKCLQDYFRWRQVDCHVNNLYNTLFWCEAKTGKSHQAVEGLLKDTNSALKNQILFQKFGINYNNIDLVYRRGTFLRYFLQCGQNNQALSQKTKDVENHEGRRLFNQTASDQQTQSGFGYSKAELQAKVSVQEIMLSSQGEETQIKLVKESTQQQKRGPRKTADSKESKKAKWRRVLRETHEDSLKTQFWVNLHEQR